MPYFPQCLQNPLYPEALQLSCAQRDPAAMHDVREWRSKPQLPSAVQWHCTCIMIPYYSLGRHKAAGSQTQGFIINARDIVSYRSVQRGSNLSHDRETTSC